jgi:hypothetical protein
MPHIDFMAYMMTMSWIVTKLALHVIKDFLNSGVWGSGPSAILTHGSKRRMGVV